MLHRCCTHFTYKNNHEEKHYGTFNFTVLWYILSWKPLIRNKEKIRTRCVSWKFSVSMSEKEREDARYEYMCLPNKEPLSASISHIKSPPSPALFSLRFIPQFLVAPNDEFCVPWSEIFMKCECWTLSCGSGKVSKQKSST